MEDGRVENVLDAVCAVLERHELDDVRVSAPHHPGRRDLSVFGLAQASTEQAESALREVSGLDAIGRVSSGKREKVGIRLSDRCVNELGEMLESGDDEPLSTGDLSPDRQVVADFCDPDATGALHVGHLRNIAIGNAIASIMEAAGATVTTQARVGDAGGSAGEAMTSTLSRLDVCLDRLLFESEFLADIEAAGDRLVEAGVAEVTPSGAVLYLTGDPSHPQLVLRRADGDATPCLRYLGLWNATRSLVGEGESIQVMGEEWLSLAKANDSLLGFLARSGDVHPSECLVHGTVAVDGRVAKSSLATAWLADELLDETAAHPEVDRVSGGDPELAERIAGMTVLGMLVADSPEKRVSVSREGLFDPVANPGWAMVLATERAWDSRYDGAPDPSVADRDYRFLIAQSQVHRPLVRRSAEELNPVHVARFHGHLCQWFLRTLCTPRLARTMRTVTASGVASLGLPTLRHLPAAGQAV